MHCTQCGTALGPTARFCPSCGKAVGAIGNEPGSAASSPDNQAFSRVTASASGVEPAHPLSFDIRRLGRGDMITGIATAVLFVSLFLPWYGVGIGGIGFGTVTLDGLYHGWMYLVLILAIATIVYLLVRAIVPIVRLPLPHWQLMVGSTSVVLIITVIGVFVKPTVTTTYSWAGFVGLVAAIAALAGAIVRRSEPEHPLVTVPPYPASAVAGQGFPTRPATQTPIPAPQGAPQQAATSAAEAQGVTSSLGICPKCRAQNPATNKFCRSCGQALV